MKIAVKADSANLGGRLVKFDAVEARLTEILSGGATLSQIPDTVRACGGCAVGLPHGDCQRRG